MVSGPSHGCGGQGEKAPEASPFESELRAEALIFEKLFADRIIDPYFQRMAEQLDAELRNLK
jgi:hypothetical protein